MRRSYQSHYRRLLPPLLDTLEFRSSNDAHQPIIEAVKLLKRYAGSKARTFRLDEVVPIRGVVRLAGCEPLLFWFQSGALEARPLEPVPSRGQRSPVTKCR